MSRLPRLAMLVLGLVILAGTSFAAPKPHVIAFGKWTTVQWFPGTDDGDPIALKVRPLFVDGRLKEYAIGPAHDVTDRLFVMRRAFRVNDGLPEESGSAPRWQWQRGGWLVVDRVTARVAQINLPEYDAFYSAASWYRDYAAYCGVSDDGKKIYAMVMQLGRRKPVLKKLIPSEIGDDAAPDSACTAPAWQRSPARVTFAQAGGDKQTFAVRGHVVDVVNDTEEEEESK